MSLTDDILLLAVETATAVAGCLVRYHGPDYQLEFPATRGRTAALADDTAQGGTVRIEHNDADFIFAASLLVVTPEAEEGEDPAPPIAKEPVDGDRIEILDGSDAGQWYELLPIPGERCWKTSDPGRLIYRVHTKRIAAPESD